MRLDKYISDALQLSRADARRLIARGGVVCNGQPLRKADAQVKETDNIEAGGKLLFHQEFVYIMLYKPEGVVSASTDKRDKTVVDLVGGAFPRRTLFPAGRLDKTSTGFVLLTDDGAFAHNLLAPKRHVEKEYLVTLDTTFTNEMRCAFEQGVTLADGSQMAPARAELAGDDPFRVRVVLTQGVYHQIKRMFGVYGAGVNALHRVRMGSVRLDDALCPGQWRELTVDEVRRLRCRE